MSEELTSSLFPLETPPQSARSSGLGVVGIL